MFSRDLDVWNGNGLEDMRLHIAEREGIDGVRCSRGLSRGEIPQRFLDQTSRPVEDGAGRVVDLVLRPFHVLVEVSAHWTMLLDEAEPFLPVCPALRGFLVRLSERDVGQ